jgi:hypothetical protein
MASKGTGTGAGAHTRLATESARTTLFVLAATAAARAWWRTTRVQLCGNGSGPFSVPGAELTGYMSGSWVDRRIEAAETEAKLNRVC